MRKSLLPSLVLCLLWLALAPVSAQNDGGEKASITVNFSKELGPMYPAWAWFGYDEPNYTYMKDGKKLLTELAELSPVPVYVRAHSLLVTGDGTAALKWGSTNAYTEDASGNPVYNWAIIDSIFDTYVQRGMKPLAQIGFMPEALSVKPQPYRHHWKPGRPYNEIYTGWTQPPKDYEKWAELVYQWVKHSVERYGKEEVESWYWELWNEPDSPYWGGTTDEYLKLYDYSAHAARRALPTIKFGGPHVTGPAGSRGAKFLHAFLQHCISGKNYVTGETGSPLDFIAYHAKGAPRVVEGHVRMDMGRQLRDIASGFKIVTSYPEVKNLPIIIGESDPEGCAACGMATNPENAYRNGTMYSSYTAASFARKYALADSLNANLLGAVSWSFEFEDQPWFYGFRDLATNGVDKPVLNVFRMFGMMQGTRADVQASQMYNLKKVVDKSIRESQRDIGAFATADKKTAAVMVWNYHDDDVPVPAAPVQVNLEGIPVKSVKLTHYRIDHEHSNSYEVWKKMGSPQNPTQAQITELEKAGQLKTVGKPEKLKVKNGKANVSFNLPSQGVSLLKLDW
ncbi:GH39 family glycosyl hydrolase [Botryobacter ruber]|uniref:GH39 family glycosyl hydrolase n=1 Tax=Botryobacter ruber TaxID=2171629 RepID=UPI000E0C2570|nr:beta-xylosidase [Botryobacter ruber]